MDTKVYGIVGSNIQYVGASPEGGVLMSTARPTIDHVAKEDGTWVLDLNRLADKAREERNRRLKECDWTVLPDVPVNQAWLDYRQALRDIPEQPGFPETIQWPEEPA